MNNITLSWWGYFLVYHLALVGMAALLMTFVPFPFCVFAGIPLTAFFWHLYGSQLY